MTQKTVYDVDGMIVRVVTLTGDPVQDAIIGDIPAGGGSVDGDYDFETVCFVSGVPTARPAIVVDPAYEIVADGEDSFWFEVPDETHISTSEGYFEATVADALVSVSSRLIGPQRILVVPPLPYQQTAIVVSVLPDDGGSPALPPTTPDIDILFSQTELTNLAVLAKPKFNVLSWDVSSDPEHDHYGLTRYESEADADADVDGVDIEPITEAFYKDADEFVNGVDCWYRVYDVDTNGNRSEKSDPAGEVARGVQTGDIEAGAITRLGYFEGISTPTGDVDNTFSRSLGQIIINLDVVDVATEVVLDGLVSVASLSGNGDCLFLFVDADDPSFDADDPLDSSIHLVGWVDHVNRQFNVRAKFTVNAPFSGNKTYRLYASAAGARVFTFYGRSILASAFNR